MYDKLAILVRYTGFSVKNKKSNRSTDRRRGDSLTEFRKETFDDNNSNENKNKSRRDHDITMANAMNTKLPAKIKGWCGTGDSLTYHINSLSWNSGCKRNESSLSYG